MSEKQLVEAVRKHLETLTDEQRMEMLSEMFEGYCRDCGSVIRGYRCYCMADE